MKTSDNNAFQILQDALEKLLANCVTEWLHQRELIELKSACHETIASLNDLKSRIDAINDDHFYFSPVMMADRLICSHFRPFKIAIETKLPNIVSIALQVIHNLLVRGHFRGGFEYPGEQNQRTVDVLVRGVATCVGLSDPKVTLIIIIESLSQ